MVRLCKKNKHRLTLENQKKLVYFMQAGQSGLGQRLHLLHKAGVYHQTFGNNIALFFRDF